jgi:pyruvate/2-oxoglutarate/acetoin dehydrogenase E1 component
MDNRNLILELNPKNEIIRIARGRQSVLALLSEDNKTLTWENANLQGTFRTSVDSFLEAEGISAEVIDPRTLVPLDKDAILASVAKTGRLVVVEPAHRTCGAAGEISAIVAEEVFDSLKAPIVRLTAPDMQIPFSPALEKQMYPSKDGIVDAVRRVTGQARLVAVGE